METDERIEGGFLRQIGRRPEDLGLRLVYADWLDERGRPDRAELLRLVVDRKRRDLIHGRHFGNIEKRETFLRSSIDKAWRLRAIDPPTPLETRADLRWLGAVFGGDVERAALGDEAPPSLLEDGAMDRELLWGWPSPALFELGHLAALDVVDRCAAHRATQHVRYEPIREAIARVATASSSDVELEEPTSTASTAGARQANRFVATRNAERLPSILRDVLRTPYQTLWQTRPYAVLSLVQHCLRTHIALAWTPMRLERAHARKRSTEAQAKAATERAEKAEKMLRSLPDRAEAVGQDASALGLELTLRRDHALEVAASARAAAAHAAASCAPEPDPEAETRALFQRIAPRMVAWLRAHPDLAPDTLITNEQRTVVDDRGHSYDVRYTVDGHMLRVY